MRPFNENLRKFLKAEHLHPDEPIHVDAVHRLAQKGYIFMRDGFFFKNK
jgi:hypothetical protein